LNWSNGLARKGSLVNVLLLAVNPKVDVFMVMTFVLRQAESPLGCRKPGWRIHVKIKKSARESCITFFPGYEE
jgi:hypothetical protein